MIYRLVYTSAATQTLSKKDLTEIMLSTHINNTRDGITGILIFKQGEFMQLLEGSRDVVTAAMERIQKDPRHSHLVVVFEETTETRLFPGWTMAFRDLSNGEDADAYSDVMNPSAPPLESTGSPDGAIATIKQFIETNGW